jgi:guanine deaminase
MLEVSGALLKARSDLCFTTHINESRTEVEEVARAFPWAADYLAVYERYGLVGPRSVLAHNVQAGDDEIRRIAALRAWVAHCPNSNEALGSGIFPMGRHEEAGARFALGTDVGAGRGFGVIEEAMAASLMQRVAARPFTITPAMMLYLATRAGAEAMALEHEAGDFSVGKSADFVILRPSPGGVLSRRIQRAETPEEVLGALFALAGSDTIAEVRVANEVVFAR